MWPEVLPVFLHHCLDDNHVLHLHVRILLRVKGDTIFKYLRRADKSSLCLTEDILEIGGRDFSETNIFWDGKNPLRSILDKDHSSVMVVSRGCSSMMASACPTSLGP